MPKIATVVDTHWILRDMDPLLIVLTLLLLLLPARNANNRGEIMHTYSTDTPSANGVRLSSGVLFNVWN